MKKSVIVIVGPTAIGKTSLAIKLARKIKGEIISADSMQGYKGMDIISQKPTRAERRLVRHHLVSFLSPQEEYSAALFAKKANDKIRDIIRRKKVPIVVGGSGLYIKALVDGLFMSKGKDEGLRKRLFAIGDKLSSLYLYNRLKDADPVCAEKIHPNDMKRIVRALEICEVEKATKTDLSKKTKGIKDSYSVKVFGLKMARQRLYKNINSRVDLMFKRGIVREAKKLLKKHLSITSRQALGVKQLAGFLNKEYDRESAKDILKRDTRRFAKRQLTWFRADKDIKWLDLEILAENEAVEAIWKELYS